MAEENKVTQTSDDLDSLGIKGLPRDRAVGWFKFEKIGDAVGGTVVDMFFAPENDGMQAQRVFTIERQNGEIWNVGLRWNSHTQTRTDAVQIGDKLGLRFEKEIPAQRKGYSPAKSIGKYPEYVGARDPRKSAAALAGPANAVKPEDFDEPEGPATSGSSGTPNAAPSLDDGEEGW